MALALEVGPEPVPIYKAIAKVFLAEQKDDEALEALETALQLQLTYGGNDHIQIAEISKEMGMNLLCLYRHIFIIIYRQAFTCKRGLRGLIQILHKGSHSLF